MKTGEDKEMGSRFCRILSLITGVIMAMLALCAGIASAEEKNSGFLGKPFPDLRLRIPQGIPLPCPGP